MAGMIPEWFTQGPDVELQVWRTLRQQLSEAWTVWHHVRVQTSFAPLEIDFLCFSPEHGLLAIEVKGGNVTLENGLWFQDGKALKWSPYQQINRAGFALHDLLCEAIKRKKLPFPFLKMVWFPAMDRPQEEPLEGRGMTLYAEDLAQVQQTLESYLPGLQEKVDTEIEASVKQTLSKSLMYHVSWQSRRSLADARIAKLTLEQARTLEAFSHFPRLRVRGCAGSGKTLLALRRACQLAQTGKRVLLLCFNLLLASHLQRITGDVSGLRIEAVNDLFLDLLKRKEDGTPDFWRRLARDVLPAAERFCVTEAPDVVIVDEGQDFSPAVWTAVKALVPAEADFIIFYDPEQNIFQRDLTAMPTFPWPDAVLTRNCRNTRAVGDILRLHAPASMVLHEDAPVGEKPEVYAAQNRRALRERLKSILARLVNEEKIAPSEIVLMGAHALQKMGLEAVMCAFPGLHYFTYRKFKGLEAPVLILLDVDERNPLWDRAACYTAISRAVHKLILLKLEAESVP